MQLGLDQFWGGSRAPTKRGVRALPVLGLVLSQLLGVQQVGPFVSCKNALPSLGGIASVMHAAHTHARAHRFMLQLFLFSVCVRRHGCVGDAARACSASGGAHGDAAASQHEA